MTDRDLGAEAADWLAAELADTLDEDYGLEISEPALSMESRRIYKRNRPEGLPRPDYFRALLALQSELIKLQDWAASSKPTSAASNWSSSGASPSD